MAQPFLWPNLAAKMTRATCAASDFPPISTTKNPNQTIEEHKILQELNNTDFAHKQILWWCWQIYKHMLGNIPKIHNFWSNFVKSKKIKINRRNKNAGSKIPHKILTSDCNFIYLYALYFYYEFQFRRKSLIKTSTKIRLKYREHDFTDNFICDQYEWNT